MTSRKFRWSDESVSSTSCLAIGPRPKNQSANPCLFSHVPNQLPCSSANLGNAVAATVSGFTSFRRTSMQTPQAVIKNVGRGTALHYLSTAKGGSEVDVFHSKLFVV